MSLPEITVTVEEGMMQSFAFAETISAQAVAAASGAWQHGGTGAITATATAENFIHLSGAGTFEVVSGGSVTGNVSGEGDCLIVKVDHGIAAAPRDSAQGLALAYGGGSYRWDEENGIFGIVYNCGEELGFAEFPGMARGYALTFTTETGGSITVGANGYYAAGTVLDIAAAADNGYRFGGWTSSGGGQFGNAGNASTTFAMPANNVTVAATFEVIPSHAVIYHPNGGTGTAPTDIDKAEGVAFTVAANTFTAPSGKQFKYWNTTANGTGTIYAVGATIIMPTGDLHLYAIWENRPSGDGSSGGSGDSGDDDAPPAPQYSNVTNGTGIGIDTTGLSLPEGVTLVSPNIYDLPVSTTGRAWMLSLTPAPPPRRYSYGGKNKNNLRLSTIS